MKDDQPQTDTLVWHYTSYGAADAILRGGLHLSDIRAMNDRSELTFAIRILSESPDPRARWMRENGVLDRVVSDERLSRTFAASFSGGRDLASQWMAYGHRGSGVALGFSSSWLKSQSIAQYGYQQSLSEVMYPGGNCTREECLSLLEFCGSPMGTEGVIKPSDYMFVIGEDPPPFETTRDMTVEMARLFLESVAARTKHPSFVDERESRLVRFYEDLSPLEGVEVKYQDDWPRRFCGVDLDREGTAGSPAAIAELLLGPATPHVPSSAELQEHWNSFGWSDLVVTRSDCPLR